MNRQKFQRRIFEAEGSERSQQLALSLAAECDPEFLETLLHYKSALDEFGGQIYIAAARDKFDTEGNNVEHNEPRGSFETWGYVCHYGHKAQLKGQETEPDVPWGAAEAPEQNGHAEAEADEQPTEVIEAESSS
jgi:hypothetical protein